MIADRNQEQSPELPKPPMPSMGIKGVKVRLMFRPKEDITAFEAVQAMQLLLIGPFVAMNPRAAPMIDQAWTSLNDETRRHFDFQEVSAIVTPGG